MDADDIRDGIRRRYAEVAVQPDGQFPYPVGRASAIQLGYRADFLATIPAEVIERFVGVGNPFSLDAPRPGSRIVDIGCGAGVDVQMAGRYVGPTGRVFGVDMSAAMLDVARAGLAADLAHVTFIEGAAEALPVESGWADLVISNGVLNLSADKAAAFAEIARILRPGGRSQAADLMLTKPLPENLQDDAFAWSN